MWLRRMKVGSATHCPEPLAASITGCGTRPAAAAFDAPATLAASNKAVPSTGLNHLIKTAAGVGIYLVSQTHLDVAGGANVRADVAANTFVVIGIDVSTDRRF